jgi:hypothetical protein
LCESHNFIKDMLFKKFREHPKSIVWIIGQLVAAGIPIEQPTKEVEEIHNEKKRISYFSPRDLLDKFEAILNAYSNASPPIHHLSSPSGSHSICGSGGQSPPMQQNQASSQVTVMSGSLESDPEERPASPSRRRSFAINVDSAVLKERGEGPAYYSYNHSRLDSTPSVYLYQGPALNYPAGAQWGRGHGLGHAALLGRAGETIASHHPRANLDSFDYVAPTPRGRGQGSGRPGHFRESLKNFFKPQSRQLHQNSPESWSEEDRSHWEYITAGELIPKVSTFRKKISKGLDLNQFDGERSKQLLLPTSTT